MISEPFYVIPYVYWFFSKITEYDGTIFIARARSGFFLACFYAYARVMTQSEERWRTLTGNRWLIQCFLITIVAYPCESLIPTLGRSTRTTCRRTLLVIVCYDDVIVCLTSSINKGCPDKNIFHGSTVRFHQ